MIDNPGSSETEEGKIYYLEEVASWCCAVPNQVVRIVGKGSIFSCMVAKKNDFPIIKILVGRGRNNNSDFH